MLDDNESQWRGSNNVWSVQPFSLVSIISNKDLIHQYSVQESESLPYPVNVYGGEKMQLIYPNYYQFQSGFCFFQHGKTHITKQIIVLITIIFLIKEIKSTLIVETMIEVTPERD